MWDIHNVGVKYWVDHVHVFCIHVHDYPIAAYTCTRTMYMYVSKYSSLNYRVTIFGQESYLEMLVPFTLDGQNYRVVNGQKSSWSNSQTAKQSCMVKTLTRGCSCDYTVYGSGPTCAGALQSELQSDGKTVDYTVKEQGLLIIYKLYRSPGRTPFQRTKKLFSTVWDTDCYVASSFRTFSPLLRFSRLLSLFQLPLQICVSTAIVPPSWK